MRLFKRVFFLNRKMLMMKSHPSHSLVCWIRKINSGYINKFYHCFVSVCWCRAVNHLFTGPFQQVYGVSLELSCRSPTEPTPHYRLFTTIFHQQYSISKYSTLFVLPLRNNPQRKIFIHIVTPNFRQAAFILWKYILLISIFISILNYRLNV